MILSNFFNILYLDFALNGQLFFQDAATSIMYGIINLHHHIMSLLIFVLIFVTYIFYRTYIFSVYSMNKIYSTENSIFMFFRSIWVWLHFIPSIQKLKSYTVYKYMGTLLWITITSQLYYNIKPIVYYRNTLIRLKTWYKFNVSHGTFLEIIWTCIPSLILLMIVDPSFTLLYAMDFCYIPKLTVKIVAHQWYWTYEYTDLFMFGKFKFTYEHATIGFFGHIKTVKTITYNIFWNSFAALTADSYMTATDSLLPGELRLLEVDFPLYFPVNTKIRLDITSTDVIHAFAVPSLGVKVDAIPGRINIANLDVLRCGLYFGQCSELCGVNHGYMPIKIIVTDYDTFLFNIITNYSIKYKSIHDMNLNIGNLLNAYIDAKFEIMDKAAALNDTAWRPLKRFRTWLFNFNTV